VYVRGLDYYRAGAYTCNNKRMVVTGIRIKLSGTDWK